MDNFLKLSDLSCEEITAVLDLADELKRKKKEKIEEPEKDIPHINDEDNDRPYVS